MAAASPCPEDLRRLLQAFAAAQFRPKDCSESAVRIQEMCCQLFERDTPDTLRIKNKDLCSSYPLTLIIPRSGGASNPVAGGEVDAGKLRDLMLKARVARCRARFPVPVILWDGKYVCRSATLSGGPEIYGRSGFDLLFPVANEEDESADRSAFSSLSLSDSSQVFSKVRAQDIHLLQQLGVRLICDLMVEKKKVKFGVYITSSEKADKENRYADFRILSLPYPGCEFFRTYRDQGYAAEGLVFDWSQQFVDAVLDVPPADLSPADVQWDEYKNWDIVVLTQNYLRLFLRCLTSSTDSSLLIHCISGWDRTPLFVSLLRLSLWADGQIHQSLTPQEITFLTLAYDWYLFGHNLNDRLEKGEEILFFCFYFLQFLAVDEFSIEAIQDEEKLEKERMQRTSKESLHLDGLDESGSETSRPHHSSSCTSLSSSASCASLRGVLADHTLCPEMSFCCVSSESSYACTPPTLTNSAEGLLSESCDRLHFATTSSSTPSDPQSQDDDSFPSQTTPVPIPSSYDRRNSKLDESWQFVSETGSIKDSPRGLPFNSPDSQDSLCSRHLRRSCCRRHRNMGMTDGSPRTDDRTSGRACRKNRLEVRKDRLSQVRKTFYQAYYSAEIGHRLKNGEKSSAGLSLLYQHLGVGGRLTAHP